MKYKILLVFTIFLSVTSAHSSFFRNENSQILDPSNLIKLGHDYSVGYLMPKGCPATLILGEAIVTAAHCVVNSQTNEWYDSKELKFVYADGDRLNEFSIKSIIVKIEKPLPVKDFAQLLSGHLVDLVILGLDVDAPLRGPTISFAGLMTLDEYKTLKLKTIGFPVLSDGKQHIVISNDCAVKSQFHEYIFNTDCPALGGSSGGPIYAKNKEDGRLIFLGIITGTKQSTETEEPINYSDERSTYGIFWTPGSTFGKLFGIVEPR